MRKTEKTIEQVYLTGMIDSNDPAKEVVPLAWSWIMTPKASVEGEEPSDSIDHCDPAQKEYLFNWKLEQTELEFVLLVDSDYYGVASTVIHPASVVRNWGQALAGLKVADQPIQPSPDFRMGYETTRTGTNLIIWLKRVSKKLNNPSLRKRQPETP